MARGASPDREAQIQVATRALNARDFESLATVFHPDIEHQSAFGAVEGEVYRGIDGQRKRWENVTATWDGFAIAVEKTYEVGDGRAVVVLRLTGVARSSRLPLDTRIGQVWTWRNGRVWRIETHVNPQDALEASGLALGG